MLNGIHEIIGYNSFTGMGKCSRVLGNKMHKTISSKDLERTSSVPTSEKFIKFVPNKKVVSTLILENESVREVSKRPVGILSEEQFVEVIKSRTFTDSRFLVALVAKHCTYNEMMELYGKNFSKEDIDWANKNVVKAINQYLGLEKEEQEEQESKEDLLDEIINEINSKNFGELEFVKPALTSILNNVLLPLKESGMFNSLEQLASVDFGELSIVKPFIEEFLKEELSKKTESFDGESTDVKETPNTDMADAFTKAQKTKITKAKNKAIKEGKTEDEIKVIINDIINSFKA